MTISPTEAEQDARDFFGPDSSPYLTLAERIARGDALTPADFNPVASDIDRRFQIGQFRLLTFAWRVGNIPAMDALLARGANPLAPLRTTDDPPRQDLLYLILVSQDSKAAPAMRALLRHGINPNTVYPEPEQPALGYALLGDNTALIGVLLDGGADPWAMDDDAPAILTPFNFLRYNTIDFLIKRGIFDNQPVARIKPIIDSLHGFGQSGDSTSAHIQEITKEIIEHSHYPSDDPKVVYILSGGKNGS